MGTLDLREMGMGAVNVDNLKVLRLIEQLIITRPRQHLD